jgi:hypothetical protein
MIKSIAQVLLLLIVLLNYTNAIGRPPGGPFVTSPQVLPKKKVTFRYLAPASVKQNIAMHEKKGIKLKSHIVSGGHAWMNCKLFLTTSLQEVFK